MRFSAIRRLTIVAGCLLGLFWGAASASAGDGAYFITFQVPGSTKTVPASINASGAITGAFAYPNATYETGWEHGFARSPEGAITTFDVSGSRATAGIAINSSGTITGHYETPLDKGLSHGFLRSPEGTITTFDPPESVPDLCLHYTYAPSINTAGFVTGWYWCELLVYHGFLRSPTGDFTVFDVLPLNEPPQMPYTYPYSVNDAGFIAGTASDVWGIHAFLRAPNGAIVVFDPGPSSLTTAVSINARGDILGSYYETPYYTDNPHGYIRSSDGTIVMFDVPGASGTNGQSMNDNGAITGWYSDANGQHGFVRSPQGAITKFDVPGSTLTSPVSINNSGTITGWYQDASGKKLGFLRITDSTPPRTVPTQAPSPNANGWNKTNATVTLKATDTGSGVKQIEYALGGAQNTGWQSVTGDTAVVTISAEGTTVLSYSATDNAGNQESSKTLTIKIDKTPPIISGMPARGCTIWPPNQKLVQVATVTARDSVSGLAPGSFAVTGTSNDPSNGQIVISGGTVKLGADKGQVYTVRATAADRAGNTTSTAALCSVPRDNGK